ncbi:MAG: hypothetical protein K1X35_09805 [Caulobacteraceae bacterium]|nr:hypothetical protein [Caulobacteraceae bacterium]
MRQSPLHKIDPAAAIAPSEPTGLKPVALSRPGRRFSVHAASEPRAAGHSVEALSFEEAALEFLDAWSPQGDSNGEVTLVVTDCETGTEHCLRVDVDSGETANCDQVRG